MDRGGIGSCCDTMEDALWHLGCRSRGGSLGCRGARCLLSGSDGTVFEAEPIELGARHLFQDAGVVHAANEGEFSQQPCIHATPLFAIRLGAESSLQPVSTEFTLLRTLQEANTHWQTNLGVLGHFGVWFSSDGERRLQVLKSS